MPAKDIAIPIVFPDYLIQVDTPEVKIDVPDFLPRFDLLPRQITVPRTKQKLPYLGHAGILFIEGKTGLTKYYEYGRYPSRVGVGVVRKQTLSDVKMNGDGRPTRKSFEIVLAQVSEKAGQSGKIKGAYIELEPGAFIKMLAYATERMKANTDPKRQSYELLSNSCLHFMKGVAVAGGADMPPVLAPQPAGYIVQVRLQHYDLDFEQPATLAVEDVELE